MKLIHTVHILKQPIPIMPQKSLTITSPLKEPLSESEIQSEPGVYTVNN